MDPTLSAATAGLEPVEQDRAFHVLDRLRDLDPAWTGVRAVERCPAAEHAVLLGENLEAPARALIARVVNEPVGIDDRGGADVLLVTPEDRTRRRARRAQDAFGGVVVPVPFLGGLEAFLLRFARVVDQVRQHGPIPGEEWLHVDDEVLQHREPADRFDGDARRHVANDDLARQGVPPVDHHRVGATDPVGARTSKRQRSVQVPLHMVKRVEQPVVRFALDRELVPPRFLAAGLRIVAADPERQRDPSAGAGRAAVGCLQDVAETVAVVHQYFRSIGMYGPSFTGLVSSLIEPSAWRYASECFSQFASSRSGWSSR